MFKGAAFNQHDRTRTGSSATKPFANGRIDVLPPGAQVFEEEYASVKARFLAIIDQCKDAADAVNDINRTLKNAVPREEFQRLSVRKDALVKTVAALQDSLSSFRVLVRAVGAESFAQVFKEVAFQLDKEFALKCRDQTVEILGRHAFEFAAGRPEATETRKQSLRKNNNRREQWQRYERSQENLAAAKRGDRGAAKVLPPWYKVEE